MSHYPSTKEEYKDLESNSDFKPIHHSQNLHPTYNNNHIRYGAQSKISSSTTSLDSLSSGEELPIDSCSNDKSSEYQASFLVYVAVLCAQMSSIAMGSTFGWSAPALEEMSDNGWAKTPYKPIESEKSLIASILTIGALFGGMFCGFCIDFFGRKKTLIGLGVPYTIGWLLIGFSHSLMPILIGRVLTGMSIGITTGVLPTYIAEISTPNIRGFIGMTFNFCVVFGILFMDIVYIFNFHWTQLAFWAVLPSALLSLSMLFMPESPTWHVNQSKDINQGSKLALASLRRLRKPNSDIDSELNELVANSKRIRASDKNKLKLSLSTLRRPDVYKPLLIGMMLLFFQQFCGINAVQFYSNTIFEKAGSTLTPKMSTLISNSFMLLATVIGSFIIDRFGRRLLYILSAFGLMASIATLGVYNYLHQNTDSDASTTAQGLVQEITTPLPDTSSGSFLPVVCVTIFVSSFSLGVGPIAWIIITEITPPQTIGLITSTSSMFAWIFTFIMVKEADDLYKVLTMHGTYWFFAGMSVLSGVFAYFLPETKGKTMEQIVAIFKYDSH